MHAFHTGTISANAFSLGAMIGVFTNHLPEWALVASIAYYGLGALFMIKDRFKK